MEIDGSFVAAVVAGAAGMVSAGVSHGKTTGKVLSLGRRVNVMSEDLAQHKTDCVDRLARIETRLESFDAVNAKLDRLIERA